MISWTNLFDNNLMMMVIVGIFLILNFMPCSSDTLHHDINIKNMDLIIEDEGVTYNSLNSNVCSFSFGLELDHTKIYHENSDKLGNSRVFSNQELVMDMPISSSNFKRNDNQSIVMGTASGVYLYRDVNYDSSNITSLVESLGFLYLTAKLFPHHENVPRYHNANQYSHHCYCSDHVIDRMANGKPIDAHSDVDNSMWMSPCKSVGSLILLGSVPSGAVVVVSGTGDFVTATGQAFVTLFPSTNPHPSLTIKFDMELQFASTQVREQIQVY